MLTLITSWLDEGMALAENLIWMGKNKIDKIYFANEPETNIDQLSLPPWFNPNTFYDAFTDQYGQDAETIIGNRDQPITADYFVIHDTSGGKEPNISNIDKSTDDRGIHLFLGTETTVYRPSAKTGTQNDWDTKGWGAMISNGRTDKFVHVELSPYNVYETATDQFFYLKPAFTDLLKIEIEGVIPENSNFTFRQYELLACAYLVCCIRRGKFLTVTTHREIDFSFCSNAHNDPIYFDFNYFYSVIGRFTGCTNNSFGITQERSYLHKQGNIDGYTNVFLPYVQHKNNPDFANQYGIHIKYPGAEGHVYSIDCKHLS
jgi:hypothetical protein